MKRAIALILVVAFTLSTAAVVFAQPDPDPKIIITQPDPDPK